MTTRIRIANQARQRLLRQMYHSVHLMNEAIIDGDDNLVVRERTYQVEIGKRIKRIPLEGVPAR